MSFKPTHGQHGTPAYISWQSMCQRCSNPKGKRAALYIGRGIKVCERWRTSFENFLADMGKRPEGCSLDRFPDNDGNYEPGNVRWATASQQSNNRRDRPRYQFKGLFQTVAEIAPQVGLERKTLYSRLRTGWAFEKAISTPVGSIPYSYQRKGK